MNNMEYIKTMNKDRLAEFLTYVPNCTDLCKDFKGGCSFSCKYRHGVDIMSKWLDKEVGEE